MSYRKTREFLHRYDAEPTSGQQRASWREVARIARELAGDDQAAANDRKDP